MKSIMEEASTIAKAIEIAWNRAGQPQEFSVKVLELPQTSFFGLKTSKSAKIAFFFNELTVKSRDQQNPRHARPITVRPQGGDNRNQQPRRPAQQRTDRAPHSNQNNQRSFADSRPGSPDNRQPVRHDSRPDTRRPLAPRPERQGERTERTERYDHPERQERQERPQPQQHAPRPEPRNSEQRPYERSTEPRETWAPEMVDVARDWVQETLVLMGKTNISIQPQVSHNYLKLTLDQPVMEDFRQEETQLKSWGSLAMEAVREKTNLPLRGLRIILESKK
jgi:hypothetical protein